jgi:hypothetical protein
MVQSDEKSYCDMYMAKASYTRPVRNASRAAQTSGVAALSNREMHQCVHQIPARDCACLSICGAAAQARDSVSAPASSAPRRTAIVLRLPLLEALVDPDLLAFKGRRHAFLDPQTAVSNTLSIGWNSLLLTP